MENLIQSFLQLIEKNLPWLVGTLVPTLFSISYGVFTYFKNVKVEDALKETWNKLKSSEDLTTKVKDVQIRVQSALSQFEYTASQIVDNLKQQFTNEIQTTFNEFKTTIYEVQNQSTHANHLAEQILFKAFDKELITSITKELFDEVHQKIVDDSMKIAQEVLHPIKEGEEEDVPNL